MATKRFLPSDTVQFEYREGMSFFFWEYVVKGKPFAIKTTREDGEKQYVTLLTHPDKNIFSEGMEFNSECLVKIEVV